MAGVCCRGLSTTALGWLGTLVELAAKLGNVGEFSRDIEHRQPFFISVTKSTY